MRKKKCERKSPAATKVREEGWGGGSPDVSEKIPLKIVEKIMMKQVVPL